MLPDPSHRELRIRESEPRGSPLELERRRVLAQAHRELSSPLELARLLVRELPPELTQELGLPQELPREPGLPQVLPRELGPGILERPQVREQVREQAQLRAPEFPVLERTREQVPLQVPGFQVQEPPQELGPPRGPLLAQGLPQASRRELPEPELGPLPAFLPVFLPALQLVLRPAPRPREPLREQPLPGLLPQVQPEPLESRLVLPLGLQPLGLQPLVRRLERLEQQPPE